MLWDRRFCTISPEFGHSRHENTRSKTTGELRSPRQAKPPVLQRPEKLVAVSRSRDVGQADPEGAPPAPQVRTNAGHSGVFMQPARSPGIRWNIRAPSGVDRVMLEVRSLTKRFSGVTAVKDVSFTVESGEILGYLGHNGAGKSTTVKMIIGLLEPTDGSILFNGRSILDDLPGFQSRLGYVPE